MRMPMFLGVEPTPSCKIIKDLRDFELLGCSSGTAKDCIIWPQIRNSNSTFSDASPTQNQRFVNPPLHLRHTGLNNLGENAGGDLFVLARNAGHSSITVTQRYIHPPADEIN